MINYEVVNMIEDKYSFLEEHDFEANINLLLYEMGLLENSEISQVGDIYTEIGLDLISYTMATKGDCDDF